MLLALADHLDYPTLPALIAEFLHLQLHPTLAEAPPNLPIPNIGRISVFHSAVAMYYAPSDPSGIGGMHRERIHATPSWRKGPSRLDTIFLEHDSSAPGMKGLLVARALLFFSFQFNGTTFPCALVHWFSVLGSECDEDTGMWIVEPDFYGSGQRVLAVVHMDTILRAAHLVPVYGEKKIPMPLHFSETLDVFRAYYVNKFADHHANEIAF